MKKFGVRILVIILLICMIFPTTAFADTAATASGTAPTVKDADYLQSVMDMIKEKYKGQISEEQLVEGALKGMFDTMDAYTTYFTPEENQSFINQLNGTFEGIGVQMETQGDFVVVIKVFPASPAEMAGILPGDKFIKVNDKSVTGLTAEELPPLVKGPAGTKVKLEMLRVGHKDTMKYEIKRASIVMNPVSYEVKGDIGYIKLDTFGDSAASYLNQALAEMDKKGIKKIILDLRNNGGGYVSEAVTIAQNFVTQGLVTKLDFKSEKYADMEYRSYLQAPKYKLAVLVNENTASASEILSGAIQDTKSGTLVGSKTFGKGVFQQMIPILKPDAYAKYSNQLGVKVVDAQDLMYQYGIQPLDSEIEGYTKMTLGAYLTPNGRMIDQQGLTPDYPVPDPTYTKNIDVGSIQKLKKAASLKLNQEGIDVYNTEKILTLAGYSVDAPDMKLDSKTVTALKKFQKDNKKSATGVLDTDTQELLNKKLDQLVLSLDKQYAKAVQILGK